MSNSRQDEKMQELLALLKMLLIGLFASCLYGVLLMGSLWKREEYGGLALTTAVIAGGFTFFFWMWGKYGKLRDEWRKIDGR